MLMPADIIPAVLTRDLTPWGMYLAADWVIKTVMLILVLASIATWTVLLAKTRELARAGKTLCQACPLLTNATQLDNAKAVQDGVVGDWLAAAQAELQLSHDAFNKDGIKERLALRLERLQQAQVRSWRAGIGILASIGAVAPFVGLFGTVWGIMNSFIGIAHANTTTLAVVAPGIAEALLATALGLIAAIPAVLIYNHFSRVLAGLRDMLGDVSAAVLLLVSRDLDRMPSVQTEA